MKKYLLLLLALFAGKSFYAQITANPQSGCAPLSSALSYPTIPGGVYYVWQVDGVVVDTAQTTNYVFTNAGDHVTQVDVYDGNGFHINNFFQYINVFGFVGIGSPIGNNTGCLGDYIGFNIDWRFQNYNGINISWDFGDGSPVVSGTNNWTQHQYGSVGNYTVTATCNSSCGTQVLTYPLTISNSAPIGNVYISSPQDTVCPNDQVYFNTPSGYDNFLVDFGDGSQGYKIREHSYSIAGTYIISATYFNSCGSSATVTDTLVVSGNVHIPWYDNSFDVSDSSICPTNPINFYPRGGSFASYSWDFGDGTSSLVSTPTKTYSSVGNYVVTLTVTNGCGYSKSISRNVYVQNNIPVDPFTLSAPDSVCPNTSALINLPNNLGDQSTTVMYFNFGDSTTATAQSQKQISHAYSAPGTYTLTASIVNGCGLSYSYTTPIVVNSLATLTSTSFMAGCPLSQACPNDSVFFMVTPPDVGSALYDFGDGTTASTPTSYVTGPDGITYAIYKHAYSALGTYVANVTVTSPCGSVITQGAGSVTVSTNNTIDKNSGFFFNQSKYYCLNEQIGFLAFGANTYKWDFGDETGTLISNASLVPIYHAYTEPGTYTISVILQNNCGATDTMTNEIFIPDSRVEITTSTVSSHCNQHNGKAIAIVHGNNSPFTYSWTNGDHNFIADTLTAGIYYVTIKDSKGCSNFAVATVSDQEAPTISVNNIIDANCHGEASGAIDVTLIGSSSPYSYIWSNGKTSEDINQLMAGPYELTVTDAAGCIATKSVNVGEPEDFTVSYVSYSTLCGFSTGVIQTSVQGSTGPYNYLWNNGYTGASVSGLSAGIYTVTVVDSKGCLKEKIATVSEKTAPIVVLDSISTINCNIGNGANVYVSTYLGASPYTYSWSNGASTEDIMNIQPGVYSLQVSGNNGCKTFLSTTITDSKPDGLSICAVTVDSLTNTNRVIWQMNTRTDIASFNVYRESSQSGLYYLVGNVNSDSLHQFIDPSANPGIRGWRYKLSTVSYCGEESMLSDLHKTIHLTLNQGLGNTVNLIWDNYEGLSFNEFYIWRYTTQNGWAKIDSLPSNLFSYTDATAPSTSVSPDLYYYIEGGPLTVCDPTRGAINTSRSNIKSPSSVWPTTSIKSLGESSVIAVYPNPTTGALNISFEDPLRSKATIDVVNSLGQLVYKTVVTAGTLQQTINLNNAADGVYFVRIQESTGLSVKRIILSR